MRVLRDPRWCELSWSLVEVENCFGFPVATCAKGSSSGTEAVIEGECSATLKWRARCSARWKCRHAIGQTPHASEVRSKV